MAQNDKYLDTALEDFDAITKNPEAYISSQESSSFELKRLLKATYDYTKDEERKYNKIVLNALPELIIEGFDLEQIWQQIELQNELLKTSLFRIGSILVNKDKLIFNELKTADTNQADSVDKDNVENNLYQNENDEEQNDIQQPSESSSSDELSLDHSDDDVDKIEDKKPKKKSLVDDEFFKLDEMEEFLLSEEKKLNNKDPDSGNDSDDGDDKDDESDVDYFKKSDDEDLDEEDDDDNEEGDKLKNPKYADFFADSNEKRRPKRNKYFEELELSEPEEEENLKSTFELREERLRKRIEKLEGKSLEDKPWQLKGEITAESRPYNSLLEEVVEFDMSSRPAPVMTEETSLKLEDIIKQRIKDKAFDSVERKAKPIETPLEYKKKLVLDQEKSKQSLAQIYEQEYLQQKTALEPEKKEKEEEEPELHKEIKKMMLSLFTKLDALSNFHYTPKPAAPELKVISNLPAVNMEEVAPVAVSDAALLAPEEIKPKPRGDVLGKTERTDTDKKRERRKKKLKQRTHAMEKKKIENKLEKLKPGLGNKYSKDKARKQLEQITKQKNVDKMDESFGSKAIKSSTAFFTQLQDEVKSQIKTGLKRTKKKNQNSSFASKKMKL